MRKFIKFIEFLKQVNPFRWYWAYPIWGMMTIWGMMILLLILILHFC